MDSEKGKFQYSALQWLYEMELVSDPQLINNLKMNIFDISSLINEVELLSSSEHRQMLIFVELNWLGRKLFKNQILTNVTERVQTLLPNFKIRVVSDRWILNMSIANVKKALTGGPNANPTDSSSIDSKSSSRDGVSATSDLLQHPEVKTDNESDGGQGTV